MKEQLDSDSRTSTLLEGTRSKSRSLAETVGFEILGSELGKDVEAAIETALSHGAVFARGQDALEIFQQEIAASIRDIESHPRGKLFQDFLHKGPYEGDQAIPNELVGDRLSDSQTAAVIRFVYSFMVNSFKATVAELLAAGACSRLLHSLKQEGTIPTESRLYVGDSVAVQRKSGKGVLRGADLHILMSESGSDSVSFIRVAGVVEVKSYVQAQERLRRQLDRHLLRAKQGLTIEEADYTTGKVRLGYGKNQQALRISVVPSEWKLLRSFRFEDSGRGRIRILHVERSEPPQKYDDIAQIGQSEWAIKLKWSEQALAEAAYEFTFWYWGKVGEIIYSHTSSKGPHEMSPAEAGRNAAKTRLYFAVLRSRSRHEQERAIALYNIYGFGYAVARSLRESEWQSGMWRSRILYPSDIVLNAMVPMENSLENKVETQHTRKYPMDDAHYPINKPDEPGWHTLQEKVANLFRKIPGCIVYTDYAVKGNRIKNVNVDVFVELDPLPGRGPAGEKLIFKIVIECKYWNRRVPQERIFALKEIVSDTGAAMGILVTERGVQRGVDQYLNSPNNLYAVTIRELELMVIGIEFARQESYSFKCADCGNESEVPFFPPVICEDCYQRYLRF